MSENIPGSEWRFRLQAATRDLIKACGGVERSGVIAGFSKALVSAWQNDDQKMIPIMAAMALEADCGRAYVTSIMAEFTGRELTAPEASDATQPTANLPLLHVDAMLTFAEATRAFAEEQGRGFTPAGAELVDRVAAAHDRSFTAFRAGLAAHKAGLTKESVVRKLHP